MIASGEPTALGLRVSRAVAMAMRARRFEVLPSYGCEFQPPEQLPDESHVAWSGKVAAHRRAWDRMACPFTGRVVAVERVAGRDALTLDVETGREVWIPIRRLALLGGAS